MAARGQKDTRRKQEGMRMFRFLRSTASGLSWSARFRLAGASLALGLATATVFGVENASAQDYPSKPVRMIVPYGAGGPTDVLARLLAQHMRNTLNQAVVVENRPGAGSMIGARVVVGAEPDGYTVLMGNISTFAIAPAISKNPGYDPRKDLVPVAKTSDASAVLIANADFPPKTMEELIAYAKTNPGKISFGSAGVGNSAHLLGELLKQQASIDMVHVPYKSGAEMTNAVVGGHVQIAFVDISAGIQLIRDGKIKGLAVTGSSRSSDFPNTPTMVELGYPEVVMSNWTAVAAPRGTPESIVEKLNAAINEALRDAGVQKAVARLGAVTTPGAPKVLADTIAKDFAKWHALAQTAGIAID
jgi:tripartite-type tricarboxylate transporter receptor subunit TctC